MSLNCNGTKFSTSKQKLKDGGIIKQNYCNMKLDELTKLYKEEYETCNTKKNPCSGDKHCTKLTGDQENNKESIMVILTLYFLK